MVGRAACLSGLTTGCGTRAPAAGLPACTFNSPLFFPDPLGCAVAPGVTTCTFSILHDPAATGVNANTYFVRLAAREDSGLITIDTFFPGRSP